MSSDKADASASVTCPAAYAFHNKADTVGNSARGDASKARRSCSTNIGYPSGGKARHRGGTQVGKAPPSPEIVIFGLTRGGLSGKIGLLDLDFPPALPDVAARPSGGLFRF